MSFTYFNRNIPDEAHEKIGAMGAAGVSVFAFAPNGGWVIVTANGGYFARGIPDECFDQLGAFIKAGDKIRVIAFTPSGGWVIVTSRTYFAKGIPDECFTKLGEIFNAGAVITCIAFPFSGGNSWVILAGKTLFARNINDECYQYLCNCLPSTRPAKKVAFTPSGGWAILAEDYYWCRNVPDECYQELGDIRKAGYYLDHLAFSKQGGWSIISNTKKPAGRANDAIRTIEGTIFKENGKWQSIWERMAKYKVPGVSIAVVLDNKIAWACNYGKLEKGKEEYVYVDTVFQAASVSKPVAAVGFWRLVQDGNIAEDENINPHLDWALPVCANAQSSWKKDVTLELLLQHRGGISGRDVPNGDQCSNYGGFGGYPDTPGVQVPNISQILNGASPSNSGPIQLTYKPGSSANGYYSGPGYVLMTKLFEDLKNQNFRTWMKQHVFQPAGMNKSTYEMVLPASLARAAAGHKSDGNVIPGKRNRYPEAAAAGLYTTSSDLCRFIIMLNGKGKINGTTVLAEAQANAMVNGHTGIPTGGQLGTPQFHFWHNGANYGFRSVFKGYPNRKAGVAILTNGDAGDTLYGEILKAIIDHYGWEK